MHSILIALLFPLFSFAAFNDVGAQFSIVGSLGVPLDAVQGAAAPANTLSVGGVFNTALPTIANARLSAFQIDSNGQMYIDLNYVGGTAIVNGGVAGLLGVGGNAASAATDSGNPVKVGGRFNTTPPTLTNGQRGDLQLDSTASLLTHDVASDAVGTTVPGFAMVIGGSDGTNTRAIGVQTTSSTEPASSYFLQVVPLSYSFKNIVTASTTTVKSGAGTLHELCINNDGNVGTAKVYDNTAASGTVIGTVSDGINVAAICVFHDIHFSTGLTIVTTGSTVDVTAIYK